MRIKEGETEEITAKQNGYEKRKKRRGNYGEENVSPFFLSLVLLSKFL